MCQWCLDQCDLKHSLLFPHAVISAAASGRTGSHFGGHCTGAALIIFSCSMWNLFSYSLKTLQNVCLPMILTELDGKEKSLSTGIKES